MHEARLIQPRFSYLYTLAAATPSILVFNVNRAENAQPVQHFNFGSSLKAASITFGT